MQREGKENLVNIEDNNDTEEFIPISRKIAVILAIVTLALLYFISKWGLEEFSSYILEEGLSLGFFLGLALFLLIIYLPFDFFISSVESLFEKVVISSKGVRYSAIFEKIDCDWKDILDIEVVAYNQRSKQTGLIVSSSTEYIINTSKGTFSLKEGHALTSWDYSTIRKVYDKIVSRAPNAKIFQREEESTIDAAAK